MPFVDWVTKRPFQKGGVPLGARHKLNVASVNGALIVAAIAGFAFGSWAVFGAIAAVLVIGAIYGGDIRTK